MSVTFGTFDPSAIPWQDKAADDILCKLDYSLGVHEVLLSGAVGSAKSTLAAWLIIRHCLKHKGARVLIGRRSLPDLKKTIYQGLKDMLDESQFVEGKHYTYQDTTANIQFPCTGSEVIAGTWADKRYKKFRSLQLSMYAIEEITENNKEDKQAYDEIKMRVGRIPHIKENLGLSMTNPDSPAHWAYKYFIKGAETNPLRHVYYSVTRDNPFLPKTYVDKLEAELDPKQARRMLYGEWTEIDTDRVYYNYQGDVNFRNYDYKYDKALPIFVAHDFNIGVGKPMSALVGQYKRGASGLVEFHCADSILIEGARTDAICAEIANRGLYHKGSRVEVYGDASGKSRDTRNIKSDYDIISTFLSNLEPRVTHELKIPLANPPLRERHNLTNASFMSAAGHATCFIYRGAADLDTGLRLTQYKKGANLDENDQLREQHVTTALGYCQYAVLKKKKLGPITAG